MLSARQEHTALIIFRVQSSSADFLGTPTAVVNMGRNLGGCPAHLATGSATDCHNTAVLTGYPASSWAQQWVLQDAGLDASGKQLVYVLDQVGAGGCGGCGSRVAVVAVVSLLGLVGCPHKRVLVVGDGFRPGIMLAPLHCPTYDPLPALSVPLRCRPVPLAVQRATWEPAPPTAAMPGCPCTLLITPPP